MMYALFGTQEKHYDIRISIEVYSVIDILLYTRTIQFSLVIKKITMLYCQGLKREQRRE